MQTFLTRTDLSRIHFGFTRNGARVDMHLVNNGKGELVATSPDPDTACRAALAAQRAARIERAYQRDLQRLNLPRIGVEYHAGKRKPYRAYCEIHGKKTYAGYFALEAAAWRAARAALNV